LFTAIAALVVCTALCLAFKESRGLGILGVFVLLIIAPLVFGSLLVVAGLLYFLFGRSRYEIIPRGNVPPPDEASRRRRGIGLLVLASGVVGALAVGNTPGDEGQPIDGVAQGSTRSTPSEFHLGSH